METNSQWGKTQPNDYLWMGLQEGGYCKMALRKVLRVMKICLIWIMVMVLPLYKHVKTDQIVLKYVQFIVLQLYLNKDV